MKKIWSLLLCTVMMFNMVVTANAGGKLDGAEKYTLGSNMDGELYEDDSVVYKFKLSNAGKISIKFAADFPYLYMELFDQDGQRLWNRSLYDNDTTQEIRFLEDLYLCEGTYYLSITNNNNAYGEYEIEINETPVYESFSEEQNGSNNSTKTSNQITHLNEYIGCIAMNDNADVYKFELSESGNMAFDLFANMPYLYVELFDEYGQRLWDRSIYDNDTTQEIRFQQDFHLTKGLYYISFSSSNHGEYKFEFLFTSAYETFSEDKENNNNQTKSANLIEVNHQYNGQLAINDDVDIYRVNLTDANPVLCITGKMPYLYVELFDELGQRVWYSSIYDNDLTNEINFSKAVKSETGIHYLSISGSSNQGVYSFYLTDGGDVVKPNVVNSTIKVVINGKSVVFDQPPVSENGRTLVPLRAIFEALGAEVLWDGNTQTVTSTKGGTKISLQLGSTQMYVNGSVVTLDVPAKVINSRTLVPVRAVSEAFGCDVDWDGNTQTVYITQ